MEGATDLWWWGSSWSSYWRLLFSRSVVSHSLWPHGLQHARLLCPSLSPGVCSNSCPLSWWCHPIISSSVIPFSSCLQSFPAPGSSPVSSRLVLDGQSIGYSASVHSVSVHNWFSVGLTHLIQSKGLSGTFSSTEVWLHWFFGTKPFLLPSSHILTSASFVHSDAS